MNDELNEDGIDETMPDAEPTATPAAAPAEGDDAMGDDEAAV